MSSQNTSSNSKNSQNSGTNPHEYSPQILFELFRKSAEDAEKRAKEFEKEMRERDKKREEEKAEAKKRAEEFEKEMKERAEEFEKEMKEREEEFNKEYKKLSGLVGGIGNNIGKVAEELFYRSLQEKLCIGEVQYDDIGQNWRKCRQGIQEEYDILLTNGKALAVVEVKHIAYMNDLDKLQRKTKNFKKLFPVYQDFDIHPVIAGMSFESGVIQEAKKRGINVLVAKGDHIEEK